MDVLDNQLLSFFHSAPQAMLILSKEGKFTALNQMAQELLGLSMAQLASVSFADLSWVEWASAPPFKPEKSNPIIDFIQSDKEVREVQRGLILPERKQTIWLKMSACYYSSSTTSPSILVCLHDITKEVEQQMAIDYRTRGQSLLLEVSRNLHFLKNDSELEPVLTEILEDVAQLFFSDRSYVYYHKALEHYLPSFFQWKRDGLSAASNESFQKIHIILKEEHQKAGKKPEILILDKKDRAPKWSWLFQEREFESIILLPLLDIDGNCVGYWALEGNKSIKVHSTVEMRGLIFLAEILGAFFDRYLKAWDLRERVKEIQCLDRVTQICLEREDIELAYLQKVVDTIPAGFLKPKDTMVTIFTPDEKFQSPQIEEVEAYHELLIKGPEGKNNRLRVDLKKGLNFLAEEYQLLERIVGIIETEWERMHSNVQIRRNNERLSKLAKSQQFYVLRVDLEGRISTYSSKFEEDYRWLKEKMQVASLVQQSSLDTICEHHHHLTYETVQKCVAAPGEIFSVILDKPSEDGTIRNTFWEFVALKDDTGAVSEIQCMGIDITEIQESKRKLERFKEISDNASNASIITDINGKVEYINDQFCQIIGQGPEAILSKEGGYFFLEEFPDARAKISAELTKSGIIENLELELPYTNGATHTFLCNAKRIDSINGDWVFYSLLDITERKQQELAIKDQKQRFEAIIRAVPDMIFVLTNEGIYKEFYPGYTNQKLDMSHLIGHNLDEAHTPEIAKMIQDALKECQSEKKVKSLQYPRKIGSRKMWFESTFAPIDSNNIIQFIRDITFRKEHEEQLQRFNIAIQQSPVGIIITNLQGFIEYASPSMQKISGYRPEQLDGMSTRIFGSGLNPAEVYRDLWTTIRSGNTWEGELLNRNRDGKEYWERLSISPIKKEDGSIYKYMALKQNVDTEKRNQQQLIIQKEIFREIAHDQSHEVRAPLARIMGLVELLKETTDEALREELMEKIKFSTEELDKILRQTVSKVAEAEKLYS